MTSPQNKNIEIIREKCIEANPSILELRPLSTWIQYKNETCIYLASQIGGLELLEVYGDEGVYIYTKLKLANENECKILGRPLTLADVLLASEHLRENIHGITAEKDSKMEGYILSIINNWNLRLSFEDQTPECHQFLADLLA